MAMGLGQWKKWALMCNMGGTGPSHLELVGVMMRIMPMMELIVNGDAAADAKGFANSENQGEMK